MVSIGFEVGVAPNRIDELGQVRVAPWPGADEVVGVADARATGRAGRNGRSDSGSAAIG